MDIRKIIAVNFNLHNPIWDSNSSPNCNSNLLADFITDPQNMVCLVTPVDLGTKLNPTNGRTSTIDLAIASVNLAAGCEVDIASQIESDHFPIMSAFELSASIFQCGKAAAWRFQ